MTNSKLNVYMVCMVVLFSHKTYAQIGGMGLYPYPYYGGGGMYGGGGGRGCGGYTMPCYYQPYPIYGGGYPCFTSVCCSCGGGGMGMGFGGGYPIYGGYPFYGNTMSSSYASSSAISYGGYFG